MVSTDERTEAELRAPGHTSLLPSWLYPLDQGLLSLWRPYAGFLTFIFSAVSFPDTPSSLGFRSSVPGTTSLPCLRTVPASRLLNVGHNPGALVLSGSSSTAGAPSTPTPSPARLAGLQVCPLPTRWMFPHRLNLRLSKKKHLYPCADDALLNSPSLRSISAAQWVILASDRFLSQPAVAPVFFFLSLLCTWGLFHSLQEHLRSARGLTLQGQPSSNDGRESWDKYPIFSVLQFGSCKGGPGVCMGVGAGRSELGTYAGLLLSVSRKLYPDFARSFVMQIFSKTWVQVGPGIHLRCPPFSLGSFLPFQRAGQMGGRCD